MTFETNPRFLRDLLAEAQAGKLQLPEFQRDYVWGDEDVRMLLASILKGFPVGALLTLRTGGEVNFRPRLLAGIAGAGTAAAEELLLDGQQRITSLHGALMNAAPMDVLKPRSKSRIKRFYYLRIADALDTGADIEDAILGLPERRIRRDEVLSIDLSTRERGIEEGCFPLNLALSDAAFDWIDDFRDHAREAGRSDLAEAGRQFRKEVLEPLRAYQMPVITLQKDTGREAVCLVFEKVNVGGKKLDAFELVTAIFAGQPEPVNLRKDWAARLGRIRTGMQGQGMVNPVFRNLRGVDFLQAVSLTVTHAAREAARTGGAGDLPQVSAKRAALLQLDLGDYKSYADAVEDGCREAGRFLNGQKILWAGDLPYPAQLVALAAIFAIAGASGRSAAAKDKLRLWFWRTALAEDFGTSAESKLATDAGQVPRWLAGGEEPARLKLLTFNPDRLESLRTRNSAAYRTFAALLLREGCGDFITGAPADIHSFGNDPMDVHHVFPRAWCKRQGIAPAAFDTILNKTPLTARTNREIGGSAPSEYLSRLESAHGIAPARMDEILRGHLIEPAVLRADDFEGFLADRKQKLAGLAARATGLDAVPAEPAEPEEVLAEDAAEEDAA